MPESRDECRPVTLPPGETIHEGIAPDDRDRARIEAWLAGVDSQDA